MTATLRGRLARCALASIALIVLATACSAPRYEYVRNTSLRTAFKVPQRLGALRPRGRSWALPPGPQPSTPDPIQWLVGIDGDPDPSVAHVLDPSTLNTDHPQGVALVQRFSFDRSRHVELQRPPELPLPRRRAHPGPEQRRRSWPTTTPSTRTAFRGVHIVFQFRASSLASAQASVDQTGTGAGDLQRTLLGGVHAALLSPDYVTVDQMAYVTADVEPGLPHGGALQRRVLPPQRRRYRRRSSTPGRCCHEQAGQRFDANPPPTATSRARAPRSGRPAPRRALGSHQVPRPAAGAVGCAASPSCGPPRSRPSAARSPTRCGSRCTTTRGSWCSLGLEVLRQLHYLIEEHSKALLPLLAEDACSAALNDRFEQARRLDPVPRRPGVQVLHLPVRPQHVPRTHLQAPSRSGWASLEAPARLVAALPFVFQLTFGFLFIIVQFVGLFWFLSRGGIDTYMPDDIETRFSDVKGQDPVLERVQENMIFLEDPESIEERGGLRARRRCCCGVPRGPGKTLMAQAVAGETAKPFVFVDPGAFIQMFMGVGILKVKSLYRKLRKLAVRYGGVIVFFDEADSLGNRGSLGGQGGGWSFGRRSPARPTTPAATALPTCRPPRDARDTVVRAEMGRVQGRDHHGRHGRRRWDGHAAGAAVGDVGPEEAARVRQPDLRRLLGMKPKPPPKYRILHIFATNMPQSLDEAMLRPGPDRPHLQGGLPHRRRAARPRSTTTSPRSSTSSRPRTIDKLATMTPYAHRRQHPGHGERGARDRDPRRP